MTEQDFLEQLHELNNKINFAKELSFRETLACSDIQDIVDRLKLKVSQGHHFFSLSARCWSEDLQDVFLVPGLLFLDFLVPSRLCPRSESSSCRRSTPLGSQ